MAVLKRDVAPCNDEAINSLPLPALHAGLAGQTFKRTNPHPCRRTPIPDGGRAGGAAGRPERDGLWKKPRAGGPKDARTPARSRRSSLPFGGAVRG